MTLFHSTRPLYLSRILKEGIKSRIATGLPTLYGPPSIPNLIYLSRDVAKARLIAEGFLAVLDPTECPVILRIQGDLLDESLFVPDEDWWPDVAHLPVEIRWERMLPNGKFASNLLVPSGSISSQMVGIEETLPSRSNRGWDW